MPISKNQTVRTPQASELVTNQETSPATNGTAAARPLNLDGRLSKAHAHVLREQYVEAMHSLPADSRDPETKNAIAVCMMRLGQFEQAIPLLRSLALNNSLQTTNQRVPQHIRVNYATALFFGGQPAGGLEVLAELNAEEDAGVKLIRDSAKRWTTEMGWLRRIDWVLNRIAPKTRPVPVRTPVGQFVWDVA